MGVLGCNVNQLLADAQCYLCVSDTQLVAYKLRLRAQIWAHAFSQSVPGISKLLADSVAWKQLSPHQRLAVEVAQVANDALIAGARTSVSPSALASETPCFCAPESDLEAAIDYLECLTRQT